MKPLGWLKFTSRSLKNAQSDIGLTILEIVKKSADIFPPLKSAAGGLKVLHNVSQVCSHALLSSRHSFDHPEQRVHNTVSSASDLEHRIDDVYKSAEICFLDSIVPHRDAASRLDVIDR